jgi:hypothetical protein
LGDAGDGYAADAADYGLAGYRTLAKRHLRDDVVGQKDVDPAAKADQADTLAGRNHVARLDEGYDAARDKAGDLSEADAATVATFDDDMLAFVLVRRR